MGLSGFSQPNSFLCSSIPVLPFGCQCILKVSCLSDAMQSIHQFIEGELVLHELTGDRTTIHHDDTVGDRIDVKDVVIDEDGRLARRF